MARKPSEIHAVDALERKGVQVDSYINKEILVPPDYLLLGNGSWAKIDFLVNYCGYRLVR